MLTPIDINGITQGFIDSRIGGRKENQDSAGLKSTKHGFLIIVCDGMGGMQGGSVASQLAVHKIMDTVASADIQDNSKMVIKKAIQAANMAIIEEGKKNPNLKGMGTTVTVLLLSAYSAITAYVGDSRIYQLRGDKKIYRTFDHSMVFEMVKKKVISEEQARLSAQSNVILNALGIKPDVQFEVSEHPYQKGDRFVLCSDGFWGSMPEEEFIKHLTEKKPLSQVLESTANLVETLGRNSGSEYDNLTAAIVEMNTNSILKEKMSREAKLIIGILSVLLLISIVFNCFLMQKSFGAKNVEGDEKVEIEQVSSDQLVPDTVNTETVKPEIMEIETVKPEIMKSETEKTQTDKTETVKP